MISPKKYLIVIIITFYMFTYEVCIADFGIVTAGRVILISSTGTTTKDIGLYGITAAEYDPIDKYLYVSDSNFIMGGIFRFKITGNKAFKLTRIAGRQDWYLRGMAFDHSTSTLYWTSEGGIFHVQVPNNGNTVSSTDIVRLNVDEKILGGITIDVRGKFLYWMCHDFNSRKIIRSNLKGTEQIELANSLISPGGIMVDVKRKKLYWTAVNFNRSRSLHSKDLNDITTSKTSNTLISFKDKSNPFVITQDDDNVYWIDLSLNELTKAHKEKNGKFLPKRLSEFHSGLELQILFVF